MTPEERIAGLEQIVAELAEIVASLSWGKHPYHQTSHEVYRRVLSQQGASHTPAKGPIASSATGRKFR